MTELEQKELAVREQTAETKKVAVVLYDEEADELGTLGSLFLRKGALGSYIYAKTVDPNGPYFHMLIEHNPTASFNPLSCHSCARCCCHLSILAHLWCSPSVASPASPTSSADGCPMRSIE
jgi:hypothetical protein